MKAPKKGRIATWQYVFTKLKMSLFPSLTLVINSEFGKERQECVD